MDVFSLRDTVVAEYIRQQVEAIYAEGRFWPEPLIQINPSYKKGANPRGAHRGRRTRSAHGRHLPSRRRAALALQAPGAGDRARVAGRELRRHDGHRLGQVALLLHPDRRRRARREADANCPRTRAIVIYPMNALANSQLEELDKFIKNVPGGKPVTFARYTGQDDTEERRRISEEPPDILLTDFMMLELLMTRQDELDRRVIGNCAALPRARRARDDG
jgi:hypothetical protein